METIWRYWWSSYKLIGYFSTGAGFLFITILKAYGTFRLVYIPELALYISSACHTNFTALQLTWKGSHELWLEKGY